MNDSRYEVRKHPEGHWVLLRRFFRGKVIMVGKYLDRDRAFRACRTLNSEGNY